MIEKSTIILFLKFIIFNYHIFGKMSRTITICIFSKWPLYSQEIYQLQAFTHYVNHSSINKSKIKFLFLWRTRLILIYIHTFTSFLLFILCWLQTFFLCLKFIKILNIDSDLKHTRFLEIVIISNFILILKYFK